MNNIKYILSNIWYIVDWFMWEYSPIYFDLFNPLKDWCEARKMYKFPVISFYKGPEVAIPRKHRDDIFKFAFIDIYSYPCGWKNKWDYISFEWCPKINITFFNKYGLQWTFHAPIIDNNCYDDNTYWESMLLYIHKFNKDIVKTYNDWEWKSCNKVDINDKDFYFVDIPTWNWSMLKIKNQLKYSKLVTPHKVNVTKFKDNKREE